MQLVTRSDQIKSGELVVYNIFNLLNLSVDRVKLDLNIKILIINLFFIYVFWFKSESRKPGCNKWRKLF